MSKGVLYYTCQVCGYVFSYKRGRRKHPKVREVDNWLMRARCPECGTILRIKDPKNLLSVK